MVSGGKTNILPIFKLWSLFVISFFLFLKYIYIFNGTVLPESDSKAVKAI